MSSESNVFSPLAPPSSEGRATIAGRIFRALREAIVTLRLLPGNSLSEAEVARQMGVSRQPVREAFIKLQEIGLVEIVPQKGTFIVKISQSDVSNARFIREAVEVAIARRAAEVADACDIAALHTLIADQQRADEAGDQEWFLELDDAFHKAIARSADCLYGWSIIEDLKAQMDRVRFLSLPEATPVGKLIAQHQSIADAIQAGDSEGAGAAMQKHLNEILTSLPRLAGAHAELFADAL